MTDQSEAIESSLAATGLQEMENPLQAWVDGTNKALEGRDFPDFLFSPNGGRLKRVKLSSEGLPIEDNPEIMLVGEIPVAGEVGARGAVHFGRGKPLLVIENKLTSGGVRYLAPAERRPSVALRPATATFDLDSHMPGNQYQHDRPVFIPTQIILQGGRFAVEVATGVDPAIQERLAEMLRLLSQTRDVFTTQEQVTAINKVVGMSQQFRNNEINQLDSLFRSVDSKTWLSVGKVLAVYLPESKKI